MVRKPEILGIILARGGSKGIPKKNLQSLGGHPLISYSISSALSSNHLTRIIVSTDDDNISSVSNKYGAEIPFIRPFELAQDDTLDFPVIKHALKWLKDNESYEPDIIVQLRPTSPLRPKGLIDKAIEYLLDNKDTDSVRGITFPNQNPFKMWKSGKKNFLVDGKQWALMGWYIYNAADWEGPRGGACDKTRKSCRPGLGLGARLPQPIIEREIIEKHRVSTF